MKKISNSSQSPLRQNKEYNPQILKLAVPGMMGTANFYLILESLFYLKTIANFVRIIFCLTALTRL